MSKTASTLTAGRPSARSNKAATLASLSDKGPTVRVNFDLDREEHKRLKLMAVEQGRTVTEILRELVSQSLK